MHLVQRLLRAHITKKWINKVDEVWLCMFPNPAFSRYYSYLSNDCGITDLCFLGFFDNELPDGGLGLCSYESLEWNNDLQRFRNWFKVLYFYLCHKFYKRNHINIWMWWICLFEHAGKASIALLLIIPLEIFSDYFWSGVSLLPLSHFLLYIQNHQLNFNLDIEYPWVEGFKVL